MSSSFWYCLNSRTAFFFFFYKCLFSWVELFGVLLRVQIVALVLQLEVTGRENMVENTRQIWIKGGHANAYRLFKTFNKRPVFVVIWLSLKWESILHLYQVLCTKCWIHWWVVLVEGLEGILQGDKRTLCSHVALSEAWVHPDQSREVGGQISALLQQYLAC